MSATSCPASATQEIGCTESSSAGGVAESVVVGETAPIGRALFEEGVSALDGLVGHVRQPRRLSSEHLLADQPVINRVERELEHPLRGRALAANDPCPLQ